MNLAEGEILLINKPLTWTSFDVVNKIRYAITKKIGTRLKVGHAGTLDPMATGLLIICTGKMTKRIDELTGLDKSYTGTLKLGFTTASYDAEQPENETFPTDHITEAMLTEATMKLSGKIEQVPPVFSAIKVEGKVAYNQARKGKSIELKPRPVEIKKFNLTEIDIPCISFEVTCSKGTYIRSLAHDFGKLVDSGAYLTSLCRTHIGDFKIENAMTVEECVAKIQAL